MTHIITHHKHPGGFTEITCRACGHVALCETEYAIGVATMHHRGLATIAKPELARALAKALGFAH